MDRRHFLKGTAVAAAVPFLPIIKTDAIEPIEIPGPPIKFDHQDGTSRNLLTPQIMVREIIRLMRDEYLKHPSVVADDRFPAKLGDLYRIRGHLDTVVNHRISSEWPFSTKELTLSMDEYSARWLAPVAMVLATQMDEDMAGLSSAVIATAPLELPESVALSSRANWRGLHARVVMAYDIVKDEQIARVDVLYGATVKE